MRKVTLFYDGSQATFRWVKCLLWAKSELREQGFEIGFNSIIDYLPSGHKAELLNSALKHHQYDIVMLAFHHSHKDGLCGMPREKLYEILDNLRRVSNLLVWLDTADSTGTARFDVLPYVDIYMKKQYLRDIERYSKPIWGSRLHSEYYHTHYLTDDANAQGGYYPTLDMRYADKLRLSWNIGLSDLFGRNYITYLFNKQFVLPRLENPYEPRHYDVHFRGRVSESATQYQRYLCTKVLDSSMEFCQPNKDIDVKHTEYVKELRNSKSVVSPFGFGEVCVRDFEAFAYGAVLIKPDCSYMITYPDWFRKNITYIPIDWDFNELRNCILDLKCRPEKYVLIAANAQDMFKNFYTAKGKKDFAKHIAFQLTSKDAVMI